MTHPDNPVSWGVLSTAKIGLDRVIGPMQQGRFTRIDAIASRDPGKAQDAARALGIARSYGSYEALLADPAIEAVYIPLPNHLHVEWAERAAAAGKHVLVEKPLGMTADEAGRLIAARDRSRKLIIEAFMVRYTPQWLKAREVIASGRIGAVHGFQAHVTYRNMDCRPTSATGPRSAAAVSWTSAATPYSSRGWPSGPNRCERSASSTATRPWAPTATLGHPRIPERPGDAVLLDAARPRAAGADFGTEGSIEVEVPVNAPDDRPTRIVVDDGRDVLGDRGRGFEFPACNQYTLQGDAVSR
jgi:hypothetical protein